MMAEIKSYQSTDAQGHKQAQDLPGHPHDSALQSYENVTDTTILAAHNRANSNEIAHPSTVKPEDMAFGSNFALDSAIDDDRIAIKEIQHTQVILLNNMRKIMDMLDGLLTRISKIEAALVPIGDKIEETEDENDTHKLQQQGTASSARNAHSSSSVISPFTTGPRTNKRKKPNDDNDGKNEQDSEEGHMRHDKHDDLSSKDPRIVNDDTEAPDSEDGNGENTETTTTPANRGRGRGRPRGSIRGRGGGRGRAKANR